MSASVSDSPLATGGGGAGFDLLLRLGVELFIARHLGAGDVLVARLLACTLQVSVEVRRADQVFDVEERGALLPDVDERSLQARQHARHLAEVDVADGARLRPAAAPFDVELGDDAVFDQSDPRLADVDADDQ